MVTDAKDPGNSSPDEWTAELDEEAQQRVRDLLKKQREEEADGDSSASHPE